MKTPLLFFFFIIITTNLVGQTAGPNNGGSFRNVSLSGSGQSWINTSNAASSDNVYATFGNLSGGAGSYTDYLAATNFGFSIPSVATISGIKIDIERSDVSTRTADYSIRIMKGGIVAGTDHSGGEYYSSTMDLEVKDAYKNYGGESDLWGETWTPADINDPGFGVAVAAQRALDGGNTDGRIDNIRITVFYAVNITLPVKLIRFSAEPKKNVIRLTWTTSEEAGMDRYEVQRSANGTDFTSIGTLISKNHTVATAYVINDYNPLQATSYYRLKMREENGKISWSKVVSVQLNTDNATALYPSPWRKGEMLFIRNPNNEKLTIQFYNNAGELVTTLSTSTGQVPNQALSNKKGILRYKVLNEKNEATGSGTVIVY